MPEPYNTSTDKSVCDEATKLGEELAPKGSEIVQIIAKWQDPKQLKRWGFDDNLISKLNQLVSQAASSSATNQKPTIELIEFLQGNRDKSITIIGEDKLNPYLDLYKQYDSKQKACAAIIEKENKDKSEDKSKSDDKSKSETPEEKKQDKCTSNPNKWGVRFVYREFSNCQASESSPSATSSSKTSEGDSKALPDNSSTQSPTKSSSEVRAVPMGRPRPTSSTDIGSISLSTPGSLFEGIDTSKLGGSLVKGTNTSNIVGAGLSKANSSLSFDLNSIQVGGTAEQIASNSINVLTPDPNSTKEWFLTLLPAMQTILPKQGARDVPNAMPGVQFRAANRVVKHHVPGMGPIYQNLGVDSLYITFVGTFTGDGGPADKLPRNLFDFFNRPIAPDEVSTKANQQASLSSKTSALTRYNLYGSDTNLFQQDGCPGQCPPPGTKNQYPIQTDFIDAEWQDVKVPTGKKSLGDIAGELDAYKEFTSFYKMAYSEGRHLEVEINMRRNRDGLVVGKRNLLDPDYNDPLREEGGNPKFKCYVRRVEAYLQYSDRMWYLIECEVTDHGDVTNLPLNLTKVVGKDEAPLTEEKKDTTQQNALLDCLMGKGLMGGNNNKLNMGGGRTLYIFKNGQAAIAKGELNKANVEEIIDPQEALIKGLSYVLAGEESNFYKSFLSTVKVNVKSMPSDLQNSSTMTLNIYNSHQWTNYLYSSNNDGDVYLYQNDSGFGFVGPPPDKVKESLSTGGRRVIYSPKLMMESIIPNLPDDGRWKSMRQYIQNSTVETTDPCTEVTNSTQPVNLAPNQNNQVQGSVSSIDPFWNSRGK